MAWDDDAYYETELEIPSGRYGKLLAMPGGVGPAGPRGEPGAPGPAGPPGPAEGVEFLVNKGVPSGYAPLGADGLVPAAHLPAADPGVDTMAELTDVTPTGLAVGTAVDAKAGRTALVAERDFHFNVLDYGAVGDGVANDQPAIQAAVTACGDAGGGTVYAPKGTYLISAPVRMLKSNVTLQGAGRSATVLKTTGDHQIIQWETAGAPLVGLCVRDLQLLGDAIAGKLLQRGIENKGASDSLIHNVWAKNLSYDGLCMLQNSVRNTISNCRVEGCQDDGINIGGSITGATIGNVVTGNVITGCKSVGVHLSDGSSFTTVTGNVVSDCLEAGINTYQTAERIGMGNHTITGNAVRNCPDGILVKDSDSNIVSGNNISGGGRSLVANNTHNTVFTGNRCVDATTVGYVDNATSSDLTIANNSFSGTKAYLSVLSPRATVQGNTVRGVSGVTLGSILTEVSSTQSNVVGNTVSNVYMGIQVKGIDCTVSSNLVTETTNHGIRVDAADCVVSSNLLKTIAVNGVYVNAGARAHVSGNRITAAGYGININNGVDTTVSDNVTTGTVNNSLLDNAGSTGTVAAHNRFDKTAILGGTNTVLRDLRADIANYGNEYASATNYHRSVWKQTKATLTATAGTTLTATGLIPAGSLLLGVTSRINVALGATATVQGYAVGDGTDTDLWGVVNTRAAAGTTGAKSFTNPAAAGKFYTTAQNVVVTATGGSFDGTGEIELIAHFLTCETHNVQLLKDAAVDKVEDVVEDLNPITTLEGEPVATTLEGQVPVEIKPAAKKRRTTK